MARRDARPARIRRLKPNSASRVELMRMLAVAKCRRMAILRSNFQPDRLAPVGLLFWRVIKSIAAGSKRAALWATCQVGAAVLRRRSAPTPVAPSSVIEGRDRRPVQWPVIPALAL